MGQRRAKTPGKRAIATFIGIALVLTSCVEPASDAAQAPFLVSSTVLSEDARYQKDALRPEDEGKAPLYDFDDEPDAFAPLGDPSYVTVIKEYVPEPFEAAVADMPYVFVAVLRAVSSPDQPIFNTADGQALQTDPEDQINIYPPVGHQELTLDIQSVMKGDLNVGSIVTTRFEISEPDFDWIDPAQVGCRMLVVATNSKVLMADGTETPAITVATQHTYIEQGDGNAVRLYSATSRARFGELLTMDSFASEADGVPFEELVQRAWRPSSQSEDWLGGESVPDTPVVHDPAVGDLVPDRPVS